VFHQVLFRRLVQGLFLQPHFALAAIAAAVATFAKVVIARILSAAAANMRGFFFADITEKRHDYFFLMV
jgi:hypothetical protein